MPRVPHSTDDLAAAELELQRALLYADAGALDAILDPEAELVDLDGAGARERDAAVDGHRTGRLRLATLKVERQRVRVIDELGTTDLVAVVTGTEAGDPFTARRRFTRTWRLHGDGWTLVASHAAAVRGTLR